MARSAWRRAALAALWLAAAAVPASAAGTAEAVDIALVLAVDVLSNEVGSELDCTMGWQEVIGRSALRSEVGRTAYVKTLCRRLKAGDARRNTN